MKAFILAAGLGTRLKPLTDRMPKALVEVGGEPMLGRVISKLRDEGYDDLVVNVHHFADMVIDYLDKNDFGVKIRISDERDKLLDTGGAIMHARKLLSETDAPFLVHNVDILSNAPLGELMRRHLGNDNDATLLVSERSSSRQLAFDKLWHLKGWHNLISGELKPNGVEWNNDWKERAFSGIHILSPEKIFAEMDRRKWEAKFSVIDFYLDAISNEGMRLKICGDEQKDLKLIDIGKPATLSQANELF